MAAGEIGNTFKNGITSERFNQFAPNLVCGIYIIITIIISERQCDALVEEQLEGRCVSVSCLALRC